MRDLYAHNFGGVADATYFRRQRHFFRSGMAYTLSSGQSFDGQWLQLTLDDLKFYIDKGKSILKELDRVLP